MEVLDMVKLMDNEEIGNIVRDLESAIAAASTRIADKGLKVTSIEVSFKTVFEKEAGGELD
ncbi:MAG: hypothetical protein SCH71_12585, partial [Desulfobulbaceae bacterium]|nr:hypothetical protein [Desulfobulbaceae bacterium]